MKAELLVDCRHHLAEGPVWHDGKLWWVNITAGELHRLDPASGQHETRAIGGLLGCAVPTDDGRWLLGHNRGFSMFNWQSGKTTVVATPDGELPRNRFNDGKCDPAGRLFAGTINLDIRIGSANLYRIDHTLHPVKVLDQVTISNGLAWSANRRTMYYTDTVTRRVDQFDYDLASGGISNRRPLVEIPEGAGYPDGMAIDAADNLWVALWGGSAVVCYDGKTGAERARVTLPVSQPSSCAFGGKDLDTLFITSAWQDLSPAARANEPLAGSIFRVFPGVHGTPITPFATHPPHP